MEKLVIWWCNLIGITDLQAIQYAVGNVGAASFLLLAMVLAYLVFLGALFAFVKLGNRW